MQTGTTVAFTTTTATEGPGIPEETIVEIHGSLRVEGNKIVDKSGSPVRLRGMSLFWSQWMPRFWNADLVRWLAMDWKVTMVRAAMGVEMGGFLEFPGVEQRNVVNIVEAAIEAGIYVVIDWHDHAADQHLERSKAFFEEMAIKYGSYPNVIFELFNEPVSQDWNTVIKPYHEQVIPVIRAHSDNVIVLGTRLWSQDVDLAAEDPVRGDNLAYSMHFYASTHTQWLRDKASAAMAKGIALFATEWGTCTASGDGALDLAEAQRWMDFLEENYISDANWAVDDKQESCAALKPGVNSTGHWGEDELTESGRWVRQTLRSRWDRLYLKRAKAIGGKALLLL